MEPLEDRRLLSLAGGGAAETQTVADLPVAAQNSISSAIGQDQSAYHAAAGAAGVALANPANGFNAQVQSGALQVSAGSDTWQMSLQGLGYGGAVQSVGTAKTSTNGNRVDCNYASIDEWYVNGPGGLEQGFTVAPSPQQAGGTTGSAGGATGSASALLTVELALGGDLTAAVNAAGDGLTLSRPDGSTALSYTGLAACDATGKTLPASMELQADGGHQDLLIHVNAAGAQGPVTIDPFVKEATLTPSDGEAGELFGSSIAVSGNTVVVGAPDDAVGGNSDQGAAYVFTESASGWANMTQTAKLTASDGAADSYFGYSVSISGETVVVGAYGATVGANAGQGAAYVFTEPVSGWPASMNQTAKLTASDGAAGDQFGYSVSISGNTVVVGANWATVGGNSKQGAAYAFTEPGSVWPSSMMQTAKLTALDGAAGDALGCSVSICGNTAVVGAPGRNNNDGAAYVFAAAGATWASMTQTATLTSPGGSQAFGWSVSISGNTVVIGAPDYVIAEGAVYVFTEPGSGWATTTQSFPYPGLSSGDYFGQFVSISGNTVVIGSPGFDSGLGEAVVVPEPPGGWRVPATITNEVFYPGYSVSIDGDTMVDGVPAASYGPGQAVVYGTSATATDVASVSTTAAANSSYTAGETVPITVTFSGAVNVTGTPELTLNDGAVANYTSGSGTTSLTFNYTVASGQSTTDLDYASNGALTLNGGSIEDTSGNAAVLTLPATGTDGLATQNITIGTPAPLPNLTPYQPSGWSDKIVVTTQSGGLTDTSPLYSNSSLYVDWAAINNGTAATSVAFDSALYIDGSLVSTWQTPAPLAIDYYTNVVGYSIGTLSAGTHTVEISVDYTNTVNESNESEKIYTKTITVDPAAQSPTLTSLRVSAAGVTTGQPVTITATVIVAPGGTGVPNDGSVTFMDGTTRLGSPVALNSAGQATLTTSALPLGIQVLTASYSGDGTNYAGSSTVIGPNSVITTYAAGLDGPTGVAADSAGDLFIADTQNNRIREVNHATGLITTVAGNGTQGYSGDNGPATAAELSNPAGVALDAAGDLFIADAGNNVVREVNHATGLITTVAGNGGYGYNGDGIQATTASLWNPYGVALDAAGDIFIVDNINNRIREVNHATGLIATVAGNDSQGYSGDNGQATAAELYYPTGVALDAAGDIFIADDDNGRVREVNQATGLISTVTSGVSGPVGVALDSAGDIFIADNIDNQICEVNHAYGVITTVAGNGSPGYNGDGIQATAAEVDEPAGVAVDSAGNLFIADTSNNRIREVASGATVVTVSPAGTTSTTLTEGASSAAFGGTTSLTATLLSSGVGVPSETIAFSLDGSSVGSATTNANGVATLTGVSLAGLNVGTYSSYLAASFAGNSSYGASNAEANLSVLPDPTTVGLFNTAASAFFLKNSCCPGAADATVPYGPPGANWEPIVGDWMGNGVTTLGLYNPVTSTFFLKNTNSAGAADLTFGYGPADPGYNGTTNVGWTPLAGDWNGDGTTTVGLYNPATGTFYLKNTNSAGAADLTFTYGPGGLGWMPIAGDWLGSGMTTVGLYAPATGTFFLKNTNSAGAADSMFNYGPGGPGWTPLAGVWNGSHATVGLYVPASGLFFLKDSNSPGPADMTFNYGPGGPGWTPLIGGWTCPSSGSLQAVRNMGVSPALVKVDATSLTAATMEPIVQQAIARWAAAGASATTLAQMANTQIVVGDLPSGELAQESSGQIIIDRTAAGYGWFVNSTLGNNREFATDTSDSQLHAIDPRAVDQMDLLTVVEHELGIAAGLKDLDPSSTDLMSGRLATGVRRLPSAADVDAIFAEA
jgi:hypothetical protein